MSEREKRDARRADERIVILATETTVPGPVHPPAASAGDPGRAAVAEGATGPGTVHPLFARPGAPALELDWQWELEGALTAWTRDRDDLRLAEYLEAVAAVLRRGDR